MYIVFALISKFRQPVYTSFKYSVLLYFFMLEHLCVGLEQESKEALATWVLVQIYTQSSFLCLYTKFLAARSDSIDWFQQLVPSKTPIYRFLYIEYRSTCVSS
jgi:hypothetical protein